MSERKIDPFAKGRIEEQSDASHSGRIEIIELLRGFAALAVCWYHFTQGVGEFLPDGLVKASGTYGYLGVPIFFVISGFIIPYTLWRKAYRIGDYGRFILKRIVRLDPPYFVSVAIVIAVGFVLMHFTNYKRGIPPFTSWQQVVCHAGYLNALLNYEWLSPVYWSLAVEFQYYLLLGLLFPLLSKAKGIFLPVFLCAAAFLFPNPNLVFAYLPWFLFGIVAYRYKAKHATVLEYILSTAALSALILYQRGVIMWTVLFGTSALILFWRRPASRIGTYLGAISYSIYLTHAPVGATIINLSKHFNPSYVEKLLVLLLALGGTIAVSHLLYVFVERPSLKLSSRIPFRRLPSALV
jgi:peptidoglycan/LPS O-acetylase OafA/YrhL